MEYKKNLITLIKICEYQDKLIKELQRILVENNENKKGNKCKQVKQKDYYYGLHTRRYR